MKIIVLNGSPKGDTSVTMQYVAYIRKNYPDHQYEILNVAQDVVKIEKDESAWKRVLDSIRSADLLLWAFPLYYLLVPSQYKRFIELVYERNASDAFAGKYAAALSTSIHFFDHTAHAYIHAISDDLMMRYLGGYSAAMHDLLEETEQKRLLQFSALTFTAVQDRTPVPRESVPLVWPDLEYAPGAGQKAVPQGTKKILILTDDDGGSPNLSAMIKRLRESFSGPVDVINLHDLDIRGGCLGCCRCGFDNTCVYTDGYVPFYREQLVPADIIVMAGSVHDRYLSSTWKQFFDRSFFKGHVPGLKGKQIGVVIAGPLRQVPHLREALTAWADNGGCNVLFVTDEVRESCDLDGLLDGFAARLVQCADAGYIPPRTFYAVGGHKIFRDNIWAGMRFVFQADYQYYRDHGLFDFPQADLKARCRNAVMVPLTRIPGFRKKMDAEMKRHMIAPFAPVLEKA